MGNVVSRKNFCVDCGKEIGKQSTRCRSCDNRHRAAPPNCCVDCGREIGRKSTRCKGCATREQWNQGILGERLQENFCMDCGQQILAHSTRCYTCANKAKWTDGKFRLNMQKKIAAYWQDRKLPQKHCKDCGKPIRHDTIRCRKCHFAERRGPGVLPIDRGPDNCCIDCGASISRYALRCPSCANKARWRDEDFRNQYIATRKKAWREGVYSTKEYRGKLSEAAKSRCDEDWKQRVSEDMKRSWARGDFDGVFQSPTSIELEVAAALDICGIKHESQYRPNGYSRVYDEFVPPNILIEVQGDYFHSGEFFPGIEQRDAEKATWAEENGYQLVVIWEHEIKEQGAWTLVTERVFHHE